MLLQVAIDCEPPGENHFVDMSRHIGLLRESGDQSFFRAEGEDFPGKSPFLKGH